MILPLFVSWGGIKAPDVMYPLRIYKSAIAALACNNSAKLMGRLIKDLTAASLHFNDVKLDVT